MALGTTNFDELNSLVGYKRSTPYEEYFGTMELSKVQKQDRIDLAEMFEEEFAEELEYLFYAYPNVRKEDIDDLKDRYLGVLEAAGLIAVLGAVSKPQEQRFYDRADVFAVETIASTAANRDTPYTYSIDRAIFMAENEANIVYGSEDFWEAVEDGATEKTWITEGDNKVRESHAEIDGLTIPIMEPFLVGGSFMMHPLDDSMGAGAEEIVNCRCSIEYGGYGESETDASKMAQEAYSNDWSDSSPSDISNEDKRELMSDSGVDGIKYVSLKEFDGDIALLTDMSNTLALLAEKYGYDEKIYVAVRRLADEDFAATNKRTITFNAMALRDAKITERNIEAGAMFSEKAAHDIAVHEFAHLLERTHGKAGLDVAEKALYNIGEKENALIYLAENISQYSATMELRQNGTPNYKEIASEVFVAHENIPTAFTEEFMRLWLD